MIFHASFDSRLIPMHLEENAMVQAWETLPKTLIYPLNPIWPAALGNSAQWNNAQVIRYELPEKDYTGAKIQISIVPPRRPEKITVKKDPVAVPVAEMLKYWNEYNENYGKLLWTTSLEKKDPETNKIIEKSQKFRGYQFLLEKRPSEYHRAGKYIIWNHDTYDGKDTITQLVTTLLRSKDAALVKDFGKTKIWPLIKDKLKEQLQSHFVNELSRERDENLIIDDTTLKGNWELAKGDAPVIRLASVRKSSIQGRLPPETATKKDRETFLKQLLTKESDSDIIKYWLEGDGKKLLKGGAPGFHVDATNAEIADNRKTADQNTFFFNVWLPLSNLNSGPLGFLTGQDEYGRDENPPTNCKDYIFAQKPSIIFKEMGQGDMVTFSSEYNWHAAIPLVDTGKLNARMSIEIRFHFKVKVDEQQQ